MKNLVRHTVWCNTFGEAAGEIQNWSLLGVKGLTGYLPTAHVWKRHNQESISSAVQISWDGNGWIKGNVGYKGFYRVNYEDSKWDALAEQMNFFYKVS